jgi:hypothetical protein
MFGLRNVVYRGVSLSGIRSRSLSGIAGFSGDLRQTTDGPMWEHQADLPRLSVPTLEESCTRYMDAVKPLSDMSDDDLAATQVLVAPCSRAALVFAVLHDYLLNMCQYITYTGGCRRVPER